MPRHSYTAWSTFDKCPLQYKLQYLDRLPQGPPSPALIRGREVHDMLDGIIQDASHTGVMTYPVALQALHDATGAMLETIIESGDFVGERRIELTREWTVGDPWVVAKVDVSYAPSADVCAIVDWKTGRTPITEYRDQGELYVACAVAVWRRDYYSTCFVNVDTGATDAETYTATAARDLQHRWKDRFRKVETETEFKPTPNKFCKWCHYAKEKGGPCPV